MTLTRERAIYKSVIAQRVISFSQAFPKENGCPQPAIPHLFRTQKLAFVALWVESKQPESDACSCERLGGQLGDSWLRCGDAKRVSR